MPNRWNPGCNCCGAVCETASFGSFSGSRSVTPAITLPSGNIVIKFPADIGKVFLGTDSSGSGGTELSCTRTTLSAFSVIYGIQMDIVYGSSSLTLYASHANTTVTALNHRGMLLAGNTSSTSWDVFIALPSYHLLNFSYAKIGTLTVDLSGSVYFGCSDSAGNMRYGESTVPLIDIVSSPPTNSSVFSECAECIEYFFNDGGVTYTPYQKDLFITTGTAPSTTITTLSPTSDCLYKNNFSGDYCLMDAWLLDNPRDPSPRFWQGDLMLFSPALFTNTLDITTLSYTSESIRSGVDWSTTELVDYEWS